MQIGALGDIHGAFETVHTIMARHPDVPSEVILQMSTVRGARALGLQGKIGELSENAWADMIAVPYTGKLTEAYDAVVHREGDVSASMIDGVWAMTPAA